MSDCKVRPLARAWYQGDAPAIGWWMCRDNLFGPGERWRWWDGDCWSLFAEPYHDAHHAAWVASHRANCAATDNLPELVIEWCDYYPTDARVARGV